MSSKLKWTGFVLFWIIIAASLFMINIDLSEFFKRAEGSELGSENYGFMNHQNHHKNHQNLHRNNQQNYHHPPIKPFIERRGTDVYIEMTAQMTDIEIMEGHIYKAWTFNGQAPGPLVVVNEGDTIHFTLKNMDPEVPHSMDFHAVHAAPNKAFADVEPMGEGTFVYKAENPGVFMYHCGTDPMLLHVANGMHGVIIVKPKDGYPTDEEVDREFVVIQNEWYKYNDMDDMLNGNPSHVVFSTKALEEGSPNTNGVVGGLIDLPFQVKAGEKVRFYVANMGPNNTSSFHVVGSLFDDVYIDGNPANHLKGMQTVEIPASGGAVVEFTLKEPGEYKIVDHQLRDAQKGAVGKIIAYDGEIPELPIKEKEYKKQEKAETGNHLNISAKNYEYNEDTYVVKAGEEVTLSFFSEEGYHGLSIEEFGVHLMGSGKTTFVPDQPGEYLIRCNIYCGSGHEEMTATLIVK